METTEQNAAMTIALLAAFADGSDGGRERAELQRVADTLGATSAVAALVKDVLLKRATVTQAAAALKTPEARRLAYELAVGVCDADELRNEAETRFLADLGAQLGLPQSDIVARAVDADELATLPLGATGPAKSGDVVAATASMSDAELEQMIVRASILNGALELLPQTLATMAIIPLQMKLVHGIGAAYGYTADRAQISDLLATLGVGLTGQYLETIGRRLLGGLFGKAGGLLGSLASGATGAALSFATTYAIGAVARRYYAGGRVMTAELLRASYADMLAQGRALQQRYLPQIEQQARTLDPSKLVQMVREFQR